MKKFIAICLIVVAMMGVLAGCNRQILDVTYSYEQAIVKLPNGEVVEGKVSSWCDYEGEAIQVVIDGVTYYTQGSNVVLISE